MLKTLTLQNPQRIDRPVGDYVTLGTCPVCGRRVTHSMARKAGTTCRYDGARFDRDGVHEGWVYPPRGIVRC